MKPFYPDLPTAEIIPLAEAADGLYPLTHRRSHHSRLVAERQNGGLHRDAKLPPPPEAMWEVTTSGEVLPPKGRYADQKDVLHELLRLIDPPRDELAELAKAIYAGLPEELQAEIDAEDRLPPETLYYHANDSQRGEMVIRSTGAEREELGWKMPDGRTVLPQFVHRYATDLNLIRYAEELAGIHTQVFAVTEDFAREWTAMASGYPGERCVIVDAHTEHEARAFLIVLDTYARRAGLMDVSACLGVRK